MACEPQDPRYRARTQISMNIDLAIWNATKHYADRSGLTPTEYVESALARVIYDQDILARIQVCRTHGCAMEYNSSGTAVACPINEGSSAHLYLGGEVAEPFPHRTSGRLECGCYGVCEGGHVQYKPESAVLYDGTPGSGSINKPDPSDQFAQSLRDFADWQDGANFY